jgi:hypothetical protein
MEYVKKMKWVTLIMEIYQSNQSHESFHFYSQ